VVFNKGAKDEEGNAKIGHYQLLEADGRIIDVESNGNNCGFAIFEKLTGKPIDQLRK
jgi:hypothetical protein